MSALQLRDAQLQGVEMLRQGFAAGHRCQMLYLPTGGGKTEIAISMMALAADKGNRSAMILDRRNLVNQTSQRLDKYKIDHSVMMAGSGRMRGYEKIQICSAQTLEKRGAAANLQILFIDEAHQTRTETKRFIANNPHLRVIGLSASPLTKGLGKVFTHVVSPISTNKLVADNLLIMPTIYCAREIDMTGAKKVAGEWSSDDVGSRATKISGDIIATWIEKTTHHFGGAVKTIVHCASVAHGAELAQKFADAGYNFVAISYKDDEDFKLAAYEEFAKPNSKITGLIAVDMLTKGFDCVLEGSRILTERGLVEIDKLLSCDRLWDGIEFVNHGGVIYKGERNVITYSGLTATPDHKVYTKYGWLQFGECAREGIEIIRTGDGATPICESSDVVGLSLQGHARKVRKFITQGVQKLWRARNIFSVRFPKGGSRLDNSNTRAESARFFNPARQNRQQRKLCTGKFALGFAGIEQLEQPKGWMGGFYAQIKAAASRVKVFGQNLSQSAKRWFDVCSDSREVSPEIGQAKRRVWDILNAGSRNRFTCEGLLVHNCPDVLCSVMARPFSKSVSSVIQQCGRVMRTAEGKTHAILIDHAGNFLRHGEQIMAIFEDGIHSLDDGAEKPAKEKTIKEKEACKCPKCQALWRTATDTCGQCGYVRPSRSKVQQVAGEVSEFVRAKIEKGERQAVYSELLGYAEEKGFSQGWAAHRFNDKFGVMPDGFQKIPTACGPAVKSYVKSRNISWANRRTA